MNLWHLMYGVDVLIPAKIICDG